MYQLISIEQAVASSDFVELSVGIEKASSVG